jgi:hypothetical protein
MGTYSGKPITSLITSHAMNCDQVESLAICVFVYRRDMVGELGRNED